MEKATLLTNHYRQHGFTLIEMMVTIAIVAVLASIAVPSMQTYVLNNRLNSLSQDFLRALQTARSEATKRQRNVVVCASADPQATTPSCSTGTVSGWITFQDTNGDWAKGDNATEPLIKADPFDSTQVSLLADGSRRVSYAASGFATPNGGTAATQTRSSGFVMCDRRGNVASGGGNGVSSVARGIVIAPTGRARITTIRNSASDTNDISDLINNSGMSC